MSEKPAELGISFPCSRSELGNRLGALLALFPSRAAAAKVAEKSVDQLKLYEKGATGVPFEVIARLALDQGVSLDWLASGQGEMKSSDRTASSGGYNAQLMQDCVQAVEELLDEHGLELAPDKKGRLVVVLYEFSIASGQVDRKSARAMIGLAA